MKPFKNFASISQFILWLFSGLWNLYISVIAGDLRYCVHRTSSSGKLFSMKNGSRKCGSFLYIHLRTQRSCSPTFYYSSLFIFLSILPSSPRFHPLLPLLLFAFHSYLCTTSNSPVLWWIVLKFPTPIAALLFLLAASRSWQQSNLDETIAFG